MLSNQAEPGQQASVAADAETGAAASQAPVVNPRAIIEVATGGNGTPNDPAGSDKPPFTDLDYLA